jgi:2,3-bisphosphoglycerate-independent phosphoglycerate mutase
MRGAGQLPDVPPLTEKYGISASCIVVNALVKGVAISAGMKFTEVQGATGTVESNLDAKAKAAIANLAHDDFVLLHVKGADNASHDGNLEQKLKMVRKIDEMIGALANGLHKTETVIAITADHATPVMDKHHTGDPVPILVSGEGVVQDGTQRFTERDCLHGGLGRIRGVDLMPIIMNLIGKTKKFGA